MNSLAYKTKNSFPDFAGMKTVVVGLGRTGESTAEFLLNRGASVLATDIRTSEHEDLAAGAEKLRELGAAVELGSHRDSAFVEADLIVVSPGVPPTIAPLEKARKRGVKITGEIELASLFVTSPIVAVTGTNGKTTTTSLIGEIFRAAGKKVFVGGNIGDPLIGQVMSGDEADVLVVEVSSFQLETVETFRPKVGVLLNLSPDHLDRYPDEHSYYEAKTRLFQRQGPEDFAVLNRDDPNSMAIPGAARKLTFSRKYKVKNGAHLDEGRIVLVREGARLAELPVGELSLIGSHNQENVMAALTASTAMGIDPATACRAAAGFKGLPHRLEFVGEYKGVRYYNDSKGTNVGAVLKSLGGFSDPVILIAGGRDKDSDFGLLKPLVRERVKLAILLGEAGPRIKDAWGGAVETAMVGDMAEAVALASNRADTGDVVLLSPACASFDMFDSYGHRGRVFTDLVGELGS